MKVFQGLVIASIGVILVSSRVVKEEKRLIKTSDEDAGQWLTENDIFKLIQKGQKFMDVTDFKYPEVRPDLGNTKAIPTELKFQETVAEVLTKLDSPRAQDFVREFSSYHNRYYSAQTGRDSQLWLLSQVASSVEGYPGNAAVYEVDHDYLQKSIVARLEGQDPELRSEVVIVGAHLDSVNQRGSTLSAPGADDNGSGSVVCLETLRAIVETGLLLNRSVEFHWYAAEEIGLRGSQAIAQNYSDLNVDVVGMFNLDVVGYHTNGIDEIAIYTDYGTSELVQFLRILTDGYLDYGRRESRCGYACSDHAPWYNQGFPAVHAAEAIDTPYMHTPNDDFDTVNFEQISEFIKLTVGFIVEIAEPSSL